MANQRTGGMTAVGILNLILGALGTLIALMVVVVGGLFAAGGAALGSETAGAEAAAEMAFAGGGFLMLIGIAILAVNLMLLISGIGILKVASWGRTLSVSSAALGIICYGADLFLSGPGLFTAFLIYCVVLMVMFVTPGWRAAFSSEAADATPTASESDQSRAAA